MEKNRPLSLLIVTLVLVLFGDLLVCGCSQLSTGPTHVVATTPPEMPSVTTHLVTGTLSGAVTAMQTTPAPPGVMIGTRETATTGSTISVRQSNIGNRPGTSAPTPIRTAYIDQDSGYPVETIPTQPVAPVLTISPVGTLGSPTGPATIVPGKTPAATPSLSTTVTTMPTATSSAVRVVDTVAVSTSPRTTISTPVPTVTKTSARTTTPSPVQTAVPTSPKITSTSPKVWFTSIPASSNSDTYVTGQVSGVPFTEYRVTLYILVRGRWWGPKPHYTSPYTMIATDGTWRTRFVTGGVDQEAKEFAAFLIPSSYDPPDVSGASSLPSELGQYPTARDSR